MQSIPQETHSVCISGGWLSLPCALRHFIHFVISSYTYTYAHKRALNTDDLTCTVEFTMTYLTSDEEITLFSFPLNYARPASFCHKFVTHLWALQKQIMVNKIVIKSPLRYSSLLSKYQYKPSALLQHNTLEIDVACPLLTCK